MNTDNWPEDFNRWVEVFTKWHQNFFYIMQRYETPKGEKPDIFDVGLARLRCMAKDKFAIAYFRHTGQWV